MFLHCTLIAISNIKNGLEKKLFDQYNQRLLRPIHVIELKQYGDPVKEGSEILKCIGKDDWLCCLDERGEALSSKTMSNKLLQVEDKHKRHVFVIGGADGLDQKVRDRANFLLSFGKLTWPHLLVRSLLAEQLYRCQQIQSNHPYHRN